MKLDITDARCVHCSRPVHARASISSMTDSEGRVYLLGHVYVYWSCPNCGAVPAELNGLRVHDPPVEKWGP